MRGARAKTDRLDARSLARLLAGGELEGVWMLFWCLLTREQDYAYQQLSLTQKKLRLLEIRAGSPTLKGTPTGTFATRQRMRAAERELATQAEAAYKRMVADWQRTQAKKTKGAGATPGRASRGPSSGQAARQVQAPGPAL